MEYVISDIHGRIDLFDKILEQINLKEGDMLYVLGDVIDRGGGLSVAVRLLELYKKGLVTFIQGNHEFLLYESLKKHRSNARILNNCLEIGKLLETNKQIRERQGQLSNKSGFGAILKSIGNVFNSFSNLKIMGDLQSEIRDSISSTRDCSSREEFETWKEMSELEDETLVEIFEMFASNKEIHKIIEVGEKQYILVHGGINYSPGMIGNLLVREEFYSKPNNKELLKEYGAREDCIVIFGHTTTRDINIELNGTYIAPNKIWYDVVNNDKIGIDCGASYPNGQLACLRLDDMKEFYVKNESRFIVEPYKITNILNEPERIYKEVFPLIAETLNQKGA